MKAATQIQTAIENIAKGSAEEGFNVLYKLCCNKSIGLIINKSRIKDEGDAQCVFDDALLKIKEDISCRKFNYISDEAFYAYLNNTCLNLANNSLVRLKDYMRKQRKGKVLAFIKRSISVDFSRQEENRFNEIFNSMKEAAYESIYELYGINLLVVEPTGHDNKQYLAAFRLLKSECKILILCKFCLEMKHEEIKHLLSEDYLLGSPDTGKTKLYRCIKHWRKLLGKKA